MMESYYSFNIQIHSLIAIFVFYVTISNAIEYEINEYWYSSDDGYIPFADASLERHYNGNSSLELGDEHFFKIYTRSKNSNSTYRNKLRTGDRNEPAKELQTGGDPNKLGTENGEVLLDYPNDDSMCVSGTKVEDECSICTCSGGQLYICRLKPCQANDFKTNCIEGTLFNPLGEKNCDNCLCVTDQISFCFLGVCKRDKKTSKFHMQCDKEMEFQLGELQSCKTCQCTSRKWSCKIIRKSCEGLVTQNCIPGTLSRSADKPCTMCYCYDKMDQVCMMDAICFRNMKREVQWLDTQHCNGGNCIEHCYNSDPNKKKIGVCVPARLGGQKCDCF